MQAAHVLGVLFGITGAVLLALKKPIICQAVWLGANLCWLAWMASIGDWAGFTMFAVYLCVTILDLYNWLRKGKETNNVS